MSTRPVVAIDGPAGSGKSTLARRLAEALDVPHVDTGVMYRALSLEALRRGVGVEDGSALAGLMSTLRFGLSRGGRPRVLVVEGRVPGEELRSPEVERDVSTVARHPEVRERMRRAQRVLGAEGGVLEGRDIGSVVFPDADVKIFLDATEAERAARRVREREAEPERPSGIAEALAERDARDARVNPFVPAEDALRIETTGLGPDEVFDRAMGEVRRRLGTSAADPEP